MEWGEGVSKCGHKVLLKWAGGLIECVVGIGRVIIGFVITSMTSSIRHDMCECYMRGCVMRLCVMRGCVMRVCYESVC